MAPRRPTERKRTADEGLIGQKEAGGVPKAQENQPRNLGKLKSWWVARMTTQATLGEASHLRRASGEGSGVASGAGRGCGAESDRGPIPHPPLASLSPLIPTILRGRAVHPNTTNGHTEAIWPRPCPLLRARPRLQGEARPENPAPRHTLEATHGRGQGAQGRLGGAELPGARTGQGQRAEG